MHSTTHSTAHEVKRMRTTVTKAMPIRVTIKQSNDSHQATYQVADYTGRRRVFFSEEGTTTRWFRSLREVQDEYGIQLPGMGSRWTVNGPKPVNEPRVTPPNDEASTESGSAAESGSTSESAKEMDAVTPRSPAETVADYQPPSGNRPAQTFGMNPKDLKWCTDKTAETHEIYVDAAQKRYDRKESSKRFTKRSVEFTRVDGTKGQEEVLVCIKKTRSERLQDWQVRKGLRVQAKLNDLADAVRDGTGKPRRSGSEYKKGGRAKDELLMGSKTHIANDPNCIINQGELVNAVIDVALTLTGVGGAGGPAGEILAGASLGVNGVDAGLVFDPYGKTALTHQGAWNNLVTELKKYERFRTYRERATEEEAEGFLKFIDAARTVVMPPQDEKSAWRSHEDRALRVGGMLPMGGLLQFGSHIANTAITVVPPEVPIVGSVIAGLTGALDFREAKHERLRRVGLIQLAEMRLERLGQLLDPEHEIAKLIAPCKDRREEMLMTGIIQGLMRSQIRMEKRWRREKGYARLQAGKAGANVAAAGAIIAGLALAPATFGATSVLSVTIAGAWIVTLRKRDGERADDETSDKALQRSADMLSKMFTREELENMVCDNTAWRVQYGKGEYLPEEQRFASGRTVTFEAWDNPYLIFRVMSDQLRDMVMKGDYQLNSKFSQILHHGLGIDPLELLAIFKVASGKKSPGEKLDYLQGRIAMAVAHKFRTVTVDQLKCQAPPHPSLFIDRFKEIYDEAVNDYRAALGGNFAVVSVDDELHGRILKKLKERFRGEGGMDAFVTGIKDFLANTEGLPHPESGNRHRLEQFIQWLEVSGAADLADLSGPSDSPDLVDRSDLLDPRSSEDLGFTILDNRSRGALPTGSATFRDSEEVPVVPQPALTNDQQAEAELDKVLQELEDQKAEAELDKILQELRQELHRKTEAKVDKFLQELQQEQDRKAEAELDKVLQELQQEQDRKTRSEQRARELDETDDKAPTSLVGIDRSTQDQIQIRRGPRRGLRRAPQE